MSLCAYVWCVCVDGLVDGKPACVSRGICCGCAAGANAAAFSEVEIYILAVLPQMSPVTKIRPRHSLVSPRQLLVQAQLVRGGQLLLNSRLGTSWGCIHLQAQVSHTRNTLGVRTWLGTTACARPTPPCQVRLLLQLQTRLSTAGGSIGGIRRGLGPCMLSAAPGLGPHTRSST